MDTNPESIDELATKPTGHEDERAAGEQECNGSHRWTFRRAATEEPAHREQSDHAHVAQAMQQAEPMRPRAARNTPPVDRSEHRGAQSADDAGADHPVGDDRPCGTAAYEMDDVENDSRRKKAQRKNDEHLMNRVPEQLGAHFHGLRPPSPHGAHARCVPNMGFVACLLHVDRLMPHAAVRSNERYAWHGQSLLITNVNGECDEAASQDSEQDTSRVTQQPFRNLRDLLEK